MDPEHHLSRLHRAIENNGPLSGHPARFTLCDFARAHGHAKGTGIVDVAFDEQTWMAKDGAIRLEAYPLATDS